MDFDAAAAIIAGLIGGAIMVVPLYMGIVMMPSQMKMNLFLLLGTMMLTSKPMAYATGGTTSPNKPLAYAAGAMVHAAMSIGFALIHVAVFVAFDLETELAAWGVLFGAIHWVIVGMGLGMMRFMHPLIRSGEMDDPGAFALKFPAMTAIGFFMLHIVFGVLVAVFYELLA